MAVDIAIAVDSAISAFISTLQSDLGGELSSRGITGMPLPAPADAAFYSYQPPADGFNRNHEVFVFVYQTSPLTFAEYYTKNVNTGGSLTTVGIGVLVAFKVAAFEPFTLDGKTVTTADIMDRRGHRYNAGVIDALYKGAREDAAVTRVDLESQASSVNFDDENRPILGLSETTWTVVQDCNIPQPQ